ncbi:hypothetical protein BJ508DRAFT_336036 [Ascobolus immersus RN42]|uniref:Uncharacterized protein n=1 Tax=Ascobolus immersus RN42 TaxID=1160509 RepID=A0A3N4HA32_ASCIM|nr:hypothetical protein BJ508DRAFT_336036 [Ascobolus immersus RN42]
MEEAAPAESTSLQQADEIWEYEEVPDSYSDGSSWLDDVEIPDSYSEPDWSEDESEPESISLTPPLRPLASPPKQTPPPLLACLPACLLACLPAFESPPLFAPQILLKLSRSFLSTSTPQPRDDPSTLWQVFPLRVLHQPEVSVGSSSTEAPQQQSLRRGQSQERSEHEGVKVNDR